MYGRRLSRVIRQEKKGPQERGDVSSEAPLLDTLPFAASAFIFGQLFLSPSLIGSSELLMGMVILLFSPQSYTDPSIS